MPYPEPWPACGGPFRNTGTHFTARRNEVGRHVLLELGCQNTAQRYWWDFTTGSLTEEGRPGRRAAAAPAAAGCQPPQCLLATVAAEPARNGTHHTADNGHVALSTLDR